MSRYHLFTDGGSGRSAGASAAIIRNCDSAEEVKIAVFMGESTNNECEIFGGIAAFSWLRVAAIRGENIDGVEWVSDSEYVLKSATQYIHNWQRNGWKTATKAPVKNQGLWRAYLELTAGLEIDPRHVRGHSGHEENESCDRVCTVLQAEGDAFLAAQGDGATMVLPDGESWLIHDGRPMIEHLREEGADQYEIFVQQLAGSAGAAVQRTPAKKRIAPLLAKLRETAAFGRSLEKVIAEEDARALRDILVALEDIEKRHAKGPAQCSLL